MEAIEREMNNYFQQLNIEEKKSIVQMIKTFLKGRVAEPGRISIEQYNKEIDEAMSRVQSGNFTTHEELEKEMQSW